jgi:hypothetical protein
MRQSSRLARPLKPVPAVFLETLSGPIKTYTATRQLRKKRGRNRPFSHRPDFYRVFWDFVFISNGKFTPALPAVQAVI